MSRFRRTTLRITFQRLCVPKPNSSRTILSEIKKIDIFYFQVSWRNFNEKYITTWDFLRKSVRHETCLQRLCCCRHFVVLQPFQVSGSLIFFALSLLALGFLSSISDMIRRTRLTSNDHKDRLSCSLRVRNSEYTRTLFVRRTCTKVKKKQQQQTNKSKGIVTLPAYVSSSSSSFLLLVESLSHSPLEETNQSSRFFTTGQHADSRTASGDERRRAATSGDQRRHNSWVHKL